MCRKQHRRVGVDGVVNVGRLLLGVIDRQLRGVAVPAGPTALGIDQKYDGAVLFPRDPIAVLAALLLTRGDRPVYRVFLAANMIDPPYTLSGGEYAIPPTLPAACAGVANRTAEPASATTLPRIFALNIISPLANEAP